MPDITPRLGLSKPKPQEFVDVGILNTNSDILDGKYSTVLLFPTEAARDAAYQEKAFDQCYVGATKDSGTPYIRRNGQWLTQGGGGTGPSGPGVPDGGNTGQVLAKKSYANQDTEWVNAPVETVPISVADAIPINPPDPSLWVGQGTQGMKAFVVPGTYDSKTAVIDNNGQLSFIAPAGMGTISAVLKKPEWDTAALITSSGVFGTLDGVSWINVNASTIASNTVFNSVNKAMMCDGWPYDVGPNAVVTSEVSSGGNLTGFYVLDKSGVRLLPIATVFGAGVVISANAGTFCTVRYVKKWGKWLFVGAASTNGTGAAIYVATTKDFITFAAPGTAPPVTNLSSQSNVRAIQDIPGTDIIRVWGQDAAAAGQYRSSYFDISNAGLTVSSRQTYWNMATTTYPAPNSTVNYFDTTASAYNGNLRDVWAPRYQYFPEKNITVMLNSAFSQGYNRYTSDGGLTWSDFGGASSVNTMRILGNIWYSNVAGKYIASALTTTYQLWGSSDLKNWTVFNTGLTSTTPAKAVEAFGKLIAVGGGKVSYTADGTNWNMPVISGTLPSFGELVQNQLIYSPELNKVIMYSLDYVNTTFTGNSSSGTLAITGDGVTWNFVNNAVTAAGSPAVAGGSYWKWPNIFSPVVVPGPGKGDPYLAVTYVPNPGASNTTARACVIKSKDGGATWQAYLSDLYTPSEHGSAMMCMVYSANLDTFMIQGTDASGNMYIRKLGPNDASWQPFSNPPSGGGPGYSAHGGYAGMQTELLHGSSTFRINSMAGDGIQNKKVDSTIKDILVYTNATSKKTKISFDGVSFVDVSSEVWYTAAQNGAVRIPGTSYYALVSTYANVPPIIVDTATKSVVFAGTASQPMLSQYANWRWSIEEAFGAPESISYLSSKIFMNLFKGGKWQQIGG